jgi:hypothetical protein
MSSDKSAVPEFSSWRGSCASTRRDRAEVRSEGRRQAVRRRKPAQLYAACSHKLALQPTRSLADLYELTHSCVKITRDPKCTSFSMNHPRFTSNAATYGTPGGYEGHHSGYGLGQGSIDSAATNDPS